MASCKNNFVVEKQVNGFSPKPQPHVRRGSDETPGWNACESCGNEKNNGRRNSTQWVGLNVGGTHFLTTKTTLGRDTNSFLYRLCQEDPDLLSDKVKSMFTY